MRARLLRATDESPLRNKLRGTEGGDAPWPQGVGVHGDRRRARRHVEGDGGPTTPRAGMRRRPNAASCFVAGSKVATGLLLLLAAAAPASAAEDRPPPELPRVFALPLSCQAGVSETSFQRISQYYLTLFKMSSRFRLLDASDLPDLVRGQDESKAREAARDAAPKWLEEADERLWKGKDLLAAGSYGDASVELSAARDAYLEHRGELADFDKLVDATLQLSVAYFQMGYDDNGEELLKEILLWRPGFVVEKKKYPAKFAAALESVRKVLAGREGGTVRVVADASSAGAKVYVDGLLKGELPQAGASLEVTGLPRGRHTLQVVREGFALFASDVDVPPAGQEAKAEPKLNALPAAEKAPASDVAARLDGLAEMAARGDFGAAFAAAAGQLAARLDVPYLLFGLVSPLARGTRLTLFLYAASDGSLYEVEPISIDEAQTSLQVNLLYLEANVVTVLQQRPADRLVRGRPAVFDLAAAAPPREDGGDASKQAKGDGGKPPDEAGDEGEGKPPDAGRPPGEGAPAGADKDQAKDVADPASDAAAKDPQADLRNLPGRLDDQVMDDLGPLSDIFANPDGKRIEPITDPLKDNGRKRTDGRAALTDKWWFWTAVGVGVAVVAGGGYVIYDQVSQPGGNPGYDATVSW